MIRKAEMKDVDAIAGIIVSAWQTAYMGVIDSKFPATLTREHFVGIFTDNITHGRETILVWEDGRVLGFVSGIAAQGDSFDCEIPGLYVHPDSQGRGIGSMLLSAMRKLLSERGFRSLVLWTLKGARNNAFYEREGGRLLLAKELAFGGCVYAGAGYLWDLL